MHPTKGFALIEIVIALSIISIAIVSLLYTLVVSNRLSQRSSDEIRANFITEEGIEGMRFLRDYSWSANFASLSPNINYYVSLNTATNRWNILSTNPGLFDDLYTRTITVERVQRDANDDIVLSGGTTDLDTLKIISQVTWPSGTTSIETYLSNVFKN